MNNAPARNSSPVSVAGGDFAARFPWYVEKSRDW